MQEKYVEPTKRLAGIMIDVKPYSAGDVQEHILAIIRAKRIL